MFWFDFTGKSEKVIKTNKILVSAFYLRILIKIVKVKVKANSIVSHVTHNGVYLSEIYLSISVFHLNRILASIYDFYNLKYFGGRFVLWFTTSNVKYVYLRLTYALQFAYYRHVSQLVKTFINFFCQFTHVEIFSILDLSLILILTLKELIMKMKKLMSGISVRGELS